MGQISLKMKVEMQNYRIECRDRKEQKWGHLVKTEDEFLPKLDWGSRHYYLFYFYCAYYSIPCFYSSKEWYSSNFCIQNQIYLNWRSKRSQTFGCKRGGLFCQEFKENLFRITWIKGWEPRLLQQPFVPGWVIICK